MISNKWLINIILAFIVVVLGVKVYNALNAPSPVVSWEGSPEKPALQQTTKMLIRRTPPKSAFHGIVRSNPFSSDRREYVEEKPKNAPVAAPVKKISGINIKLLGIMMVGNYRKALVWNPRKTEERPGDQWVTEGEEVAGFLVSQIKKESILLSESGETYEIRLYDKKKGGNSKPVKKEERPSVVNADVEKEPEPAKVKKAVQPDDDSEYIITPFGKVRKRKN